MIARIVDEARAEDRREGGRFDRDGWGNFFLEDWKRNPAAVNAAWLVYDEMRASQEERPR
jgi:hypothetical protein